MAEEKNATKQRVSRRTLEKHLAEKRKEPKVHSARYVKEAEKLDGVGSIPLNDAIGKVKSTASTKFDSSVELHIHLHPKKGKKGAEDEYARGVLHLPHGVGKTLRVVILDEDKIESLTQTQKIDFDVAIATPALMPKMGKIAKLLGTKGKMPNPKIGTVTNDPEKIKADIEAGRVEYRQDSGRNVHQMIGKVSWDDEKLLENAQAVLKVFTKNRIDSVSLTSSMGPSVKIDIQAK